MKVERTVRGETVVWTVHRFRELDSTSLEAVRRLQNGAGEGCVICADLQTSGKGRRGRNWHSPEGGGLYFSLILSPWLHEREKARLRPEHYSAVTIAAACCICRVLRRETGGSDLIRIKWPNDLVAGDRKVCGILTELYGRDLVLGIGINLRRMETVPEELEKRMDTLDSYRKLGCDYEQELLDKILAEWDGDYRLLLEAGDLTPIRTEYETMLINKGKQIRLLENPGAAGDRQQTGAEREEAGIPAQDNADPDASEVLRQKANGPGASDARIQKVNDSDASGLPIQKANHPEDENYFLALGIDRFGQLQVEDKEGRRSVISAGEVSVRGVKGYV